jgi:hypothetical protein
VVAAGGAGGESEGVFGLAPAPAVQAHRNDEIAVLGHDDGASVVRIRGRALFGPVITPAPKGEAAGELWDGLALVAKADGFFELKRSRDRTPSFD